MTILVFGVNRYALWWICNEDIDPLSCKCFEITNSFRHRPSESTDTQIYTGEAGSGLQVSFLAVLPCTYNSEGCHASFGLKTLAVPSVNNTLQNR